MAPDLVLPLQCPHCGEGLAERENSLICSQKHSFDVAKQGYVNLLPASATNSKSPGDTQEMLEARRRHLEGGHYDLYRDAMGQKCASSLYDNTAEAVLVDVGSGEGFYTDHIAAAMRTTGTATGAFGIDIAKVGVRMAAGRYKDARFAVASAHKLPVLDRSVDVVSCVFSPINGHEVRRVLKDNGTLVIAGPGPEHLDTIRERVYEQPIAHTSISLHGELADFTLVDSEVISTEHVLNQDQMMDLLQMTPYWWHAQQRMTRFNSDSYRVTSSFEILSYRK